MTGSQEVTQITTKQDLIERIGKSSGVARILSQRGQRGVFTKSSRNHKKILHKYNELKSIQLHVENVWSTGVDY